MYSQIHPVSSTLRRMNKKRCCGNELRDKIFLLESDVFHAILCLSIFKLDLFPLPELTLLNVGRLPVVMIVLYEIGWS